MISLSNIKLKGTFSMKQYKLAMSAMMVYTVNQHGPSAKMIYNGMGKIPSSLTKI